MLVPLEYALPVTFETVSEGALGADVSTTTIVATEVEFPTLSVPVRVNR